MTKKLISIFICCVLALECLSLAGCRGQHESISNSEEKHEVIKTDSNSTFDKSVSNKSNYEVTDEEIADYLNYNFQDRSMYIAGLKVFKEFGKSNEGSVSISTDGSTLTFNITKATGTVTGAVDGPYVYFKMDLTTNKITDKKFEPAPNYDELGKEEFIEHSREIIQLTDERMVEIGEYFKEMIMEIESN
jgi:ABC-type oligopeptide transport system substrate-binding subunit